MSQSALETLLEKVGNEKRQEGHQEGELATQRRNVLRLGRRRLGEPTPEQLQLIEACVDTAQLEHWFDQALTANTWVELLG